MHIATLDNVIVDDHIERPDININMTSFISSAFLYTAKKGCSASVSKETIE